MKLALTEVYEVATFYAHFDVVKDGPEAAGGRPCASAIHCPAPWPAPRSCWPRCRASSARTCACVRAPCMGACDRAPVAAVGHVQTFKATPDKIAAAAKAKPHAQPTSPAPTSPPIRNAGGYTLLKALPVRQAHARRSHQDRQRRRPARLGGAGFPTGRKWSLVRAEPAPRLFAVNADEGEPGTFKDRFYLERDPHRFIEGMLIAAWVVEARGHLPLHPRRISGTAADA